MISADSQSGSPVIQNLFDQNLLLLLSSHILQEGLQLLDLLIMYLSD